MLSRFQWLSKTPAKLTRFVLHVIFSLTREKGWWNSLAFAFHLDSWFQFEYLYSFMALQVEFFGSLLWMVSGFHPPEKALFYSTSFLTFKCDFFCRLSKTVDVIYSQINFNKAEVSPLKRGSSISNKIDKTCLFYSPLGIIKHIFIPGQLWFRRWVKGTSPCCLQFARKIETENNKSIIMEML